MKTRSLNIEDFAVSKTSKVKKVKQENFRQDKENKVFLLYCDLLSKFNSEKL